VVERPAGPRRVPGSRPTAGVVSGFALRLIRESIGLTQAGAAELLDRDLATVQGWESGRRPLTALRASDLLRLRAKLLSQGAPPDAFDALRDGLDADLLISAAVEAGASCTSPIEHPLALAVHRRDFTNLVTWPFTGEVPSRLAGLRPRVARRGPVAGRPVLGAEARERFFDHLLVVADRFRGEADAVLRRQAIYLLGFDERGATRHWLRDEQRAAVRTAGHSDSVPSWVAVRSSAVALAQDGDPEPVQAFVARALGDDVQESANVNYWAYWVGEIAETHVDDRFMAQASTARWSGAQLLEHLTARVHPGSPHLALNAHTLSALVLARPRLLEEHPRLRAAVRRRIEPLLDRSDLPLATERELVGVAYASRLAQR
jgi:transcriptional regulator with XRE-family HTH domain